MKLKNVMDDLKFDKRMVDWNLNNGVITKEDLAKHLEGLSDKSDSMLKMDLFNSEMAEVEAAPMIEEPSGGFN